MSEFEFWDELGNIFNAIVAYQHKTIEFNKRFVNPWLRLGAVFDQNDRNSDAILAARKAIEIDQENGSNWLALGDVYFKMGSFDDAANSYSKAIELNPRLGWAYANLALTNATRQKYAEAVNLYVKSLELIEDEKDRSMIWNRLGNVYRKVNDYENAFIAFQMADECDGQNTGFNDRLDDVTLEQKVMPIVAEVFVNNNGRNTVTSHPVIASEPVQLDEALAVEEIAVTLIANSSRQDAESTDSLPVGEMVDGAVYTPVEENHTVVETDYEFEIHVSDGIAELQDVAVQDTGTSDPDTLIEAVEPNLEFEEPSIAVDEPMTAGTQSEVENKIVTEDAVVEDIQPQEVVNIPVEKPAEAELSSETEPDAYAAEAPDAEETRPQVVNEISVEELVKQETSPEFEMDAPVAEQPDAEDVQSEAVVDASMPGVINEDSCPEVEAETATDETIVEEIQPSASTESLETEGTMPAMVVEPSAEAVNNDAVQSSSENTPSEIGSVDASADTTVAFLVSQGVETYADPSSLNRPVVLVVEDIAEFVKKSLSVEDDTSVVPENEMETRLEVETDAEDDAGGPCTDVDVQTGEVTAVDDDVAEIVAEIVALVNAEKNDVAEVNDIQPEIADAENEVVPTIAGVEDARTVSGEELPNVGVEPAYEEFLKDAIAPDVAVGGQPIQNDLMVEPDTKNAHVWNELGNVYFNTGAFEEAITAYSKAIELDSWFAWPYSNLALVYVQKEKYAEAILLYQRSIELFSSDKDKATTWNRLGNVYRRLTDYDNAIACYQRADELDPNNATRSLRSRFSLLGSLSMEQSSSIAG